MMDFLLIPVWAAVQICFVRLFLSSFLMVKCGKWEAAGISLIGWLMISVFELIGVGELHRYAVLLLAASLILLVVHGEYGARGLCLLAFVCLIPAAVDMVANYLTKDINGLPYLLVTTGAKAFPMFLLLVLRHFGMLADKTEKTDPDPGGVLLRQYMEMQQESMGVLEQSYRMQRKSTHEFEHHLQVLRELLEQEQVETARDYLNRLKKDRSIHVMSVSSNHPVVDAILNQKYQTAQESEIKMQIQVNDLSALDIPSDCLTVVLTNLLDNSIEACRRISGHREIICSILQEDGLYISIRNTSDPVRIVDGRIPTSKSDSLSHGFGLMSVSHALDQLNAEYTFGYEEGWFQFAAEIA